MATYCESCNGRMAKTDDGYTCMNSACDGGGDTATDKKSVKCKCGETMSYRGLDSRGAPNYTCTGCGTTAVL